MIIEVDINDKYLHHLKNLDIKEYINELIEKDIYLNSEKFQKDKNELSNRLKNINNNIILHEDMWKNIDEL